jgi:hypothetical protein
MGIPEHRRHALEQRLRGRFPGLEDLDALIGQLSEEPCPVREPGDDDRYHLVVVLDAPRHGPHRPARRL